MDGLFKVVAGCFSRNLATNVITAERLGVSSDRVYQSLDCLIEKEAGKVDAVCVLTPTPDHFVSVLKILDAGVNVICEKALATSLLELNEIKSSLNSSKGQLFVTFNYAGYPMVREARQLISSGRIGNIQQVTCEMPQESFAVKDASPQNWRRRDYDIPCVSLDLGVHVHHLVDYVVAPKSFRVVSALQRSYGKVEGVADTCYVLASCDDTVTAAMMWGKAALGKTNGLSLKVFGDRGALEWSQIRPEYLVMHNDIGESFILERGRGNLLVAQQTRYNRFKAGHPSGFLEAFANLYADIHQSLTGGESDLPDSFGLPAAERGLVFLTDVFRASRNA